jgi:hypothetical protein
MKRIWGRETLRFVDAWACKRGNPEDDEDERDGIIPVLQQKMKGESDGVFGEE